MGLFCTKILHQKSAIASMVYFWCIFLNFCTLAGCFLDVVGQLIIGRQSVAAQRARAAPNREIVAVGLEAFSQILDALAFLLVTPEFLGGERLQAFRGYLSTIISSISFWLNRSSDVTTTRAFASLSFYCILLLINIAAIYFFFDRHFVADEDNIIRPLLLIGCVILVAMSFLSMALFILKIVQSVLARTVAFSIGTGLFLLSRCIMIWLAWTHA
jgi:hypothetical protein